MKKDNIFYFVFILTILLIRIGVFLFPENKIKINNTVIHHFWIGFVLFIIILLFIKKYLTIKLLLFSISLGIMTDELVYMILGDGPVNRYWNVYSLAGVVIIAVIVYIFKSYIIKIIKK